MEYPKINSLYKREGMTVDPVTGKNVFSKAKKHPLIIGDYALPEYALIKQWHVFEKIDGTNIRITFEHDTCKEMESPEYKPTYRVRFDGRTKDSSIPTFLLRYLQDTFTVSKLQAAFPTTNRVVLYGEGYGPKIQSGNNYRDDVSFICFDIYAEGEWWLKYEDRLDICEKLGIDHVPCYGQMTEQEIVMFVKLKPNSALAFKHSRLFQSEGIVATTDPILRLRSGQPLKFKLRCEDFD